MKKIVLFFLLAMLLTPAALADIIMEPVDDFYSAHAAQCEYLPRQYTANGEKGYVALWKSPESPEQTETISNGQSVWCNFLYTDGAGQVWGTVFAEDSWEELRGWAKLSEWVIVPDYLSFEEAYGDEFVSTGLQWDGTLTDSEKVYLWQYPCSGGEPREASASWLMDSGGASVFEKGWVDSEGRTWGFSVYASSVRNTWVCLSDLDNPDIPADPSVLKNDVKLIPPAEVLPEPSIQAPVPVIVLVVGVVAATAVLIVILYRKRGAK